MQLKNVFDEAIVAALEPPVTKKKSKVRQACVDLVRIADVLTTVHYLVILGSHPLEISDRYTAANFSHRQSRTLLSSTYPPCCAYLLVLVILGSEIRRCFQ